MIFNTKVDNFYQKESHKERNLYYKVFSGYLFNELIEGYTERKNAFFEMLIANCDKAGYNFGDNILAKQRLKMLSESEVFVTFDYHPIQNFKKSDGFDNGEMSDILISSRNAFCSIECKYDDNYTFDKDVEKVHKRIVKYASIYSLEPLQVILIPKQMHTYSKQAKKIRAIECPLVFAHWEQLFELINISPVKDFLTMQLKRKKCNL